MDLARTHTPLGDMLLIGTKDTLIGSWFMENGRCPPLPPLKLESLPLLSGRITPEQSPMPLLQLAAEELDAYFGGRLQRFTVPVGAEGGTDFQRRVWDALRAIPFAQTLSYTELAARLGIPKAVRPVGGAVGRNPLNIFIPCHRVVGKNGSLTGYGGGLDRKRYLLDLERRGVAS